MGRLEAISGPADVRAMSPDELTELASEIRTFLVEHVARGGGHLGPNLGIVELTLAVHRVFDSPADPVIFDVGHQAYVHKIVTGRAEGFDTLRTRKGLSGYPSRDESPHDWVENSHASPSLSYADGLAKAFALRGEHGRTVVAVIGDGAMTGGMAWEALNNIAANRSNPVVVVLNDNGRSYAPTIGGMAERLAALRLRPGYERVLDQVKSTLPRTPVVGRPLYSALHAVKSAVKDWLLPQTLFADLGLKYVGPIDGHDVEALEKALRRAKGFRGPVLVHCLTQKGRGYPPAERDDAEQMHSPPAFDPRTGRPVESGAGESFGAVFGREIVRLAADRPDVVAITAAMCGPTGLDPFAHAYPNRIFDVGIAEQHAVTSAAGLAMGGMHPVVALYATFLNRALDQLLMDCALHRLGVTVVLDRAGVTGPDGPSHHGMWDMTLAAMVPGLRMAAPRDAVDPGRGAGRSALRLRRSDRAAVPQRRGARTGSSRAAGRRSGHPDRTGGRPRPGRAAGRRRYLRHGRRRRRGQTGRPGHRRHRRRPALGAPGAATRWPSSRWSTGWWSPSRTAAGPEGSVQRWRTGWRPPASRCGCSGCRRSSCRPARGPNCSSNWG